MPRYYFDVRDDTGVYRDQVGLDLPDMDSAIAEARKALADMTRESLATDGSGDFDIVIRDGDGGPVRLTVNLTTERPDGT
ncbi:MAG: hypothetical protein EOP22_16405 [Hyphomicrobiales bacterium]|nr:MAG: hypothetical protein EOP22_16405 [Hyphomicrobiales bacterium]